jgi:hypothetical protein
MKQNLSKSVVSSEESIIFETESVMDGNKSSADKFVPLEGDSFSFDTTIYW